VPTTINGIGTWYWGKRNLATWHDTCEHCGRSVELRSYDTTLYFVFLFVPILPLGKKHVFDECPSCRKHRVSKLQDWEEHRQRTIEAAEEAFRLAPQDAGAARALIATLLAFREQERFAALAPNLRKAFALEPEALALLGTAHRAFGDLGAAEQCLLASLGLQNDPDVREQLGLNLIEQMRPDDARRHIQPLLDARAPERVPAVLHLVRGYQAVGDHREALRVLDTCQSVFPHLAQEREIQKLRRTSEKLERSGRPHGAKEILRTPAQRSRSSLGTWFARLALPGLALLLLLGYAYEADRLGRERPVWLLNGLTQPYEVEIAGQRHKLRPQRPERIEIPEGEVLLRVLDAAVDEPEQRHTLRTELLTRPLDDPLFVLNPDRAALVTREETVYSKRPSAGAAGGQELLVGESFYRFEGINYVFQEFPETMKLKSGSQVRRSRVAQVPPLPTLAAFQGIAELVSPPAALSYLRRRALGDPGEHEALLTWVAMVPPEESLPLLRSRLDARPVQVDWHRAYQTVIQRASAEHDLPAEYRRYLEAEPADAELRYLLGRVTDQPQAAEALLLEAAGSPAPSAHAANALAWLRLAQGRFDEGLEMARQAVLLRSERGDFRQIHRSLQLALGHVDELLAENGKQGNGMADSGLAAEQVVLLAARGDAAGAEQAIKKWCKPFDKKEDSEQHEACRAYLSALVAYAGGDVARFVESGSHAESLRFDVALAAGRLEEAAQLAAEPAGAAATRSLSLYVAAEAAGNPELAAHALQAAIEALRPYGRSGAVATAALSGELSESAPLLELGLDPELKRLVLAAVGLRQPRLRTACAELGRRLNYDPRPPYLLLRQVLD
jgi:tetratricopeptide (TPR) repeat protein